MNGRAVCRVSGERSDGATVAYVDYEFFARSETFIYNYLTNLRRFSPVAVGLEAPLTNTDLFPFPADRSFGFDARRESAGPVRDRLRNKYRSLRHMSVADVRSDQIAWATRIARRRHARLVHAHFGPIGWRCLALKRALGVPLVTSFYGFDVSPELAEQGPDWPSRRQELFETGDLFLTEGPVMRERLVALGCPQEKVRLQRIAIDLKKTPFRERGPVAHGPARIVFAGRFVEKKGLEYALEAVAHVVREGRDIDFRIVGDGPLADRLHTMAESLDLGGHVTWLGFLDHAALLKEMDDAVLFLHPSVTARDGDTEGGAPTVLLEAQALGLPVVSTTHADIPNVTSPAESAILVPERDASALADAITVVLDDPQRWASMGRAGRRKVEEHHDIRKEAPALEDTYRSLIARGVA